MQLLANRPKSGALKATNSDLAFWGDFAFQGNYDGLQITDISNPRRPRVVSQLVCPGSQNDVSVWGTLAFLSVDSRRTDDSCASTPTARCCPSRTTGRACASSTGATPGAEGDRQRRDRLRLPHAHAAAAREGGARPALRVLLLAEPAAEGLPAAARQDQRHRGAAGLAGAAKVSPSRCCSRLSARRKGTARSEVSTSGCHDITVYPSRNLAAGACMGQGVLLDIATRSRRR
jgi:hypothetical protein